MVSSSLLRRYNSWIIICCEGNYTCSGQTSLASVDYTVLVTTENLLFPLRSPEDVTTTEGQPVTDYTLSSLYLGEEMSD